MIIFNLYGYRGQRKNILQTAFERGYINLKYVLFTSERLLLGTMERNKELYILTGMVNFSDHMNFSSFKNSFF